MVAKDLSGAANGELVLQVGAVVGEVRLVVVGLARSAMQVLGVSLVSSGE